MLVNFCFLFSADHLQTQQSLKESHTIQDQPLDYLFALTSWYYFKVNFKATGPGLRSKCLKFTSAAVITSARTVMFSCCGYFQLGFHITVTILNSCSYFAWEGRGGHAQCCSTEELLKREPGFVLPVALHTHFVLGVYKGYCFDASTVMIQIFLRLQFSPFPSTWPPSPAAHLSRRTTHLKIRRLRRSYRGAAA